MHPFLSLLLSFFQALARLPTSPSSAFCVVPIQASCFSTTTTISSSTRRRKTELEQQHQDAKDMQRDSIFINGLLHVGSEESYDQIMQAARDACRSERERAEKIRATTTTRTSRTRTTRNGGESGFREREDKATSSAAVTTILPPPDEKEDEKETLEKETLEKETLEKETLEKFVRMVLRCSNRTTSGGDAYDVLFRLVRHSEFSITRPSASSPLSIDIDVGPWFEVRFFFFLFFYTK